MFVEEVRDLHPTNERGGNHVVIAIIYQSHLALEITDILFPGLYLEGKVVIAIFPQLPSGSVLVVQSILHLPEISERLFQERIEPVLGGTL